MQQNLEKIHRVFSPYRNCFDRKLCSSLCLFRHVFVDKQARQKNSPCLCRQASKTEKQSLCEGKSSKARGVGGGGGMEGVGGGASIGKEGRGGGA